jgi:hypothetical protein
MIWDLKIVARMRIFGLVLWVCGEVLVICGV